MSIGGMAGAAGTGASYYLELSLARLKAAAEKAAATTAVSGTGTGPGTDNGNAVTGSALPALSDQVIGALVTMQLQSAATPSNGYLDTPIAQTFSAMDTDGDDILSQSELETAIGNAGGTADQADTVFSALGGSASSGISEDRFKQAAVAGRPSLGDYHHYVRRPIDSGHSIDIFSLMDQDRNGSISADELRSALQPKGGTGDLFTSIDSNDDKKASKDELLSYLQRQAKQAEADQPAAFAQAAAQSYISALSLSVPEDGVQSAVA